MVKSYRKKPVCIEAIQYLGDSDNQVECLDFCEGGAFATEEGFFIETLEGTMRVSINDYIIKGVQGEFYPCKPDIFEETYNEAENIEVSSNVLEKAHDDSYYGFQVLINVPKNDIWYGNKEEVIKGILETCEYHLNHLVELKKGEK